MAAKECWLLWNGGTGNYAPGDVTKDIEHFDSLRELKDAFWRRLDDPYYPCVSDETPDHGGQEGWVFFYDPNDESNGPGDPYPDRIISHGPRGGIRVEH